MATFSYTVTEHDAAKPWVVVGHLRHIVELDPGTDFYTWAAQHWPSDRYTVKLDPWQNPRAAD